MSERRGGLGIIAFEGFFGASHQAFLEGLAGRSAHRWQLVTLPASKWKQRMRSGAGELAEKASALGTDFDLVFATDMLDLVELVEALPEELRLLPRVLYFHENQFTYPVRFAEKDHWRYGLTNLTSALAADRVVFNSEFHRDDFLAAVPGFLGGLPPDVPRPERPVERLAERSAVIHPGIDVAGISCPRRSERGGPLRVLWNHRWEHDKRPEAFFSALEALAREGADYRAVVCGESFARKPEVFARAPEVLGARLEHLGYAPTRAEYVELLGTADVAVSTAAHEFFGIAWLEACAAGCMPLVPARLSYPGLVPARHHGVCVYADDDDLLERLRALCADPGPARGRAAEWRAVAARFAWPRQAALFDALLEELAGRAR
jgi:glycosyltransferase involved in cell wall biosynthesis